VWGGGAKFYDKSILVSTKSKITRPLTEGMKGTTLILLKGGKISFSLLFLLNYVPFLF
jgi:hypothetical protein